MSSKAVTGRSEVEGMIHRLCADVQRVENAYEETKTNPKRNAFHSTGEIEAHLERPRAGFHTSHGVRRGVRNGPNGG